MNARFVTIAAALALSSAAGAEPAKTKAPQPTRAQSRPAPVVLASADQVVGPAAGANQATPVPKRRAMRVTNCRCGDGQAREEQQ